MNQTTTLEELRAWCEARNNEQRAIIISHVGGEKDAEFLRALSPDFEIVIRMRDGIIEMPRAYTDVVDNALLQVLEAFYNNGIDADCNTFIVSGCEYEGELTAMVVLRQPQCPYYCFWRTGDGRIEVGFDELAQDEDVVTSAMLAWEQRFGEFREIESVAEAQRYIGAILKATQVLRAFTGSIVPRMRAVTEGEEPTVIGEMSWAKLSVIQLIALRETVLERGFMRLDTEAMCDKDNRVYFKAKIVFFRRIDTSNPMQIATAFGMVYQCNYDKFSKESKTLGIEAFASKHGIDLSDFELLTEKQ
jgi:hypothetical protein